MPEDCVFCRLLRGETEAPVVFQDEISVAFLDHRPVFLGHTLLIPRVHYQTLPDLPAHFLEPLFRNAQLLARAVQTGLEAEGTLVLMNNTVSQRVPHLHIHVIPRRTGDGLRGFLWPRQRYADADTERSVQSRIRDAISAINRKKSF